MCLVQKKSIATTVHLTAAHDSATLIRQNNARHQNVQNTNTCESFGENMFFIRQIQKVSRMGRMELGNGGRIDLYIFIIYILLVVPEVCCRQKSRVSLGNNPVGN